MTDQDELRDRIEDIIWKRTTLPTDITVLVAQAIIDEFGLTVEERPAHQCIFPGCVSHSTTDPRGFVGTEAAVVITEKRVVGKWERQ